MSPLVSWVSLAVSEVTPKTQWDICGPYRHTDNNTTFNDMSFSTKKFAMIYK